MTEGEEPTVFSNEDISITDGLNLMAPFNSTDELTVGQTPCANLRFTLLNDVGQIENFRFGRFKAWLGAQIVDGTPAAGAKTATFTEYGKPALYEFSPIGTFIATTPDILKEDQIQVDAHDQMVLFDVTMPSAEELEITYPVTLVGFIKKMIAYINTQENVDIELKSESFTNADLSITAHPKDYANKTMREVLGWAAEAAGSIARFTRDGKLEMAWFANAQKNYTRNDYTKYTPHWYNVAEVNSLRVRNQDETAESTAEVSGLPVATPRNYYVIQGNPFLS